MLGPSDPMPVDRSGLERVEVGDAVLWRRTATAGTATRSAAAPGATARPRRVPSLNAGRTERSALTRDTPHRAAPGREVREPHEGRTGDGRAEVEAGLLALEAGSSAAALECLRRATFRDPHNAIAQFALARAYLAVGDLSRAHAALLHTRRLLAPLAAEAYVPGSDDLPVATLRQTVQTYLVGPSA
jgi:predicted Zn-dependent protease